jgi:ABC-type nitrate/sulfonate/bicarbonate transport system substrate-binding protein
MKTSTFRFLALVFLFSLLTQPAVAQFAEGGEGKYLILGTTSKTVGYMGPWVAKRKGFFAAEGLNVDIPILKSSTTGMQALIGGSTQFDATSIDTMIAAYEKGVQDVEVVGGIINGATYTLVAGKKFHSFKELKGATIGVSSLTSGATSLLRLMLEKNGLHYPRDVVLLSVGGTPERFTALESGRVDAVVLAAPLSFKALDLGFSKIGDVFEFVTHYQHSALVVKKSWARDNVDTVHRVLRALVRSFQWLHHNREEAVSLISSELNLEKRYAEAGWEEYARSKAWPLKGEIDIEGVETQIKIWAQREKGALSLSGPGRYVNETYLKAVHRELSL